MHLRVIGKPSLNTCTEFQRLSATYNPDTGLHIIDCNVDVVTLGVAINVLKSEFDKCLEGLEPGLAEKIRRVTEEVVRFGQDSDKDSQS